MSRKTLKQKLKSQTRELKQVVAHQHAIGRAAVTGQVRIMQSVAMAHGLLVTIGEVEKVLKNAGVDVSIDPAFLEIQENTRARISQCTHALASYGLTQEQINERVMRGH